jgi:hypothetical protein
VECLWQWKVNTFYSLEPNCYKKFAGPFRLMGGHNLLVKHFCSKRIPFHHVLFQIRKHSKTQIHIHVTSGISSHDFSVRGFGCSTVMINKRYLSGYNLLQPFVHARWISLRRFLPRDFWRNVELMHCFVLVLSTRKFTRDAGQCSKIVQRTTWLVTPWCCCPAIPLF